MILIFTTPQKRKIWCHFLSELSKKKKQRYDDDISGFEKKSRYISLPNILTEMDLVPELLQDEVSVRNLSKEALGWLSDVDRRSAFSLKGRIIHRQLRQDGSQKVAKIIFEELEKCQMEA